MPAAKAMLPALNMAKVKQLDEHSLHDIPTSTRTRRRGSQRDQLTATSAQQVSAHTKSSPYTAPRQPKPIPSSLLQAPATSTAGSKTVGHAMIQSGFASIYNKPIVVPALLLPPTLDKAESDGPASARMASVGGNSAASQLAVMRGAITTRGAPPHNLYGANNGTSTRDTSSSQQPAVATSSNQQQPTQQPQQHMQTQQQHALQHQLDTASRKASVGQQGPGQQHAVRVSAGAHNTSSRGSSPDSADASTAWESGAITPAQALRRYSEYLTSFEQSEILDYPHVYFVGRSGAPKIKGNPHANKANCGYDDDRGDYTVVPHDQLAYRYEVLGILGKGSFGQVLKVHDFKTNTLRAVKVIRNKKRFHHQALVELKVLQHLKQCDPSDEHHVIHMQDHFIFRNHLCITFEMLSVNLYEFVKQNNFAGLSLGLIRRFAHQILLTLRYLKGLRIIHCDLKPENILLRQPNRSVIKVIDFGSSCFNDEKVYTYIQSRFYRSPEVILGLAYGCEIDMWSFGAILAELYTGYPLFPGEDEQEQLACIMEVIGMPPAELLATASRRKLFFDSTGAPRLAANSHGKTHTPSARSLVSVLRGADPDFLDLLSSCLRWDPSTRITPDEALAHRWVAGDAAAASLPSPAAPRAATSATPRALPAPPPPQQQVPSTPRTAAAGGLLHASTSGGTGTTAPKLLTQAAAVATVLSPAGQEDQTMWANTSSSGQGTGAGGSNVTQHATNLGPVVKPLNLTGAQGFAMTNVAKPPSNHRNRNGSSGAAGVNGNAAAPAISLANRKVQPMVGVQGAGAERLDSGGNDAYNGLPTGMVLSPSGAPVTPGKQARGLAPSLVMGSPCLHTGDMQQGTGFLPSLGTPRRHEVL